MEVSELVRVLAAQLNDGDDIPIASFPAAIPYFLVRLTAVCVEKHEIDVVREFVLRAIALGLDSPPEIAGFLGVQIQEVESELSLIKEHFFASSAEVKGRYRLTEKGILAISKNGLRRVVEREVACCLNGVSRKIEIVSGELLPKRKLPAKTLILPSVPARSPKVDELDFSGVKVTLLNARSSFPKSLEITRLGRVVRASGLFLLGHLMLRRGSHSVPVICVGGAAHSDLARTLGAHPALQEIKGIIERAEKLFRRKVSQLFPVQRKVALPESKLVRQALVSFIGFADSTQETRKQACREFVMAVDVLLNKQHWVSETEWHIILVYAFLKAKDRVLIVPPVSFELFDGLTRSLMMEAANRGVSVEVRLPEPSLKELKRNSDYQRALKNISLSELSSSSERFGLVCDEAYLVVGTTKGHSCSMGQFSMFFGVVLTGERNIEDKLTAYTSQASDVAIVVKGSRKKGAL